MKKILILFFISFTSYAQTKKGSFSIGTGTISYERQAQSKTVYGSKVVINPNVGYLLSDNFELGISALCEFAKYQESTLSFTNNNVVVMPYLMYYFGKERFQPFIGIRGGLIDGRDESAERK